MKREMNLNSDNYELVMFDLLEGNLSEADELKVMEQIESDEFLFKEWKLFKSTVLVCSPKTVYKGKSMLLKDEYAVLHNFGRWVAAAASVALVVAFIFYWPHREQKKMVHDSAEFLEKEKNMRLNISEVQQETVVMTTKKKDKFEPVTRLKSQNNEVGVGAQKLKLNRKKGMDRNEHPQNTDIQDNIVLSDKVIAQYLPERIVSMQTSSNESSKIEIVQESSANVEKNRIEILGDDNEYLVDNESVKEKILTFATNKSLKRMMKITAVILAKARHPKLKMIPDFKGEIPSLNIEIETEGYHVIASLQPSRNKNN